MRNFMCHSVYLSVTILIRCRPVEWHLQRLAEDTALQTGHASHDYRERERHSEHVQVVTEAERSNTDVCLQPALQITP